MRMFRSDWLRTPSMPFDAPSRTPGFGSRYGVRVERAVPARPLRITDVREEEFERAVLQYVARIDRAA